MSEWDDPQHLTGVVLAAQANFYRVGLDPVPLSQSGFHNTLLCTRRSRLKKLGQQVVVGDRVTVHRAGERGVIESVAPRQSFLSRPSIANVDQALVIFALSEPALDPVQLSRFLVQAEASGLPIQVGLNKCDLVSSEEQRLWQERLQSWGYDPIFLSAKHQIGLEALHRVCQNRISVVMGLSGVGKSTLLNHLLPDTDLATQAVSGRLRQGRHTTRHVELFPLSPHQNQGWIADSPGFNQADLSQCQAITLIDHFPEARTVGDHCQFRDCLHQQEPGCRIRELSWERYPIYLSLLTEVIDREMEDQASSNSEDTIKYKSTSKTTGTTPATPGQAAIPRLDTRYRQRSRRQRKQADQHWTGDVSEILEEREDSLEA